MRRVTPYLLACIVAAALPLLTAGKDDAPRHAGADFPGWPAAFEGRPLVETPLDGRDARFAAAFPGRIAAFTNGERRVLMRWVTTSTRKLHPAAHCFRGAGYAVQPAPPHRDAGGSLWGSFKAARDGETLLVRERIYTLSGSWSDVSAWYWSALFGRDPGPWWSVTVVEKL